MAVVVRHRHARAFSMATRQTRSSDSELSVGGHAVHLPGDIATQIVDVSRRMGATPFVVLMSAYARVLSHHMETEDVTVGTTYSNRDQYDFQSLIGPTIAVPALRFDLPSRIADEVLIARVRTALAEALNYQDAPLDTVAEYAKDLPHLHGQPLFRTWGARDLLGRSHESALPPGCLSGYQRKARRTIRRVLDAQRRRLYHGRLVTDARRFRVRASQPDHLNGTYAVCTPELRIFPFGSYCTKLRITPPLNIFFSSVPAFSS